MVRISYPRSTGESQSCDGYAELGIGATIPRP